MMARVETKLIEFTEPCFAGHVLLSPNHHLLVAKHLRGFTLPSEAFELLSNAGEGIRLVDDIGSGNFDGVRELIRYYSADLMALIREKERLCRVFAQRNHYYCLEDLFASLRRHFPVEVIDFIAEACTINILPTFWLSPHVYMFKWKPHLVITHCINETDEVLIANICHELLHAVVDLTVEALWKPTAPDMPWHDHEFIEDIVLACSITLDGKGAGLLGLHEHRPRFVRMYQLLSGSEGVITDILSTLFARGEDFLT